MAETDGKVSLGPANHAASYDVIDEITGRAILSGARVMGVRIADLRDNSPLAVILRYPV